MRPRHLLSVLTLFGTATLAQSQSSIVPSSEPSFVSFMHVALLVGKPVSDVAPLWPLTLSAGTFMPSTLHLSPAHRISLTVVKSAISGDGIERVESARYLEETPDTLVLMRRVAEIQRQLESSGGAPGSCSAALTRPMYLYAVQDISLLWPSGINGQRTVLTWSVSKERRYQIQVDVGPLVQAQTITMPCDAKMP